PPTRHPAGRSPCRPNGRPKRGMTQKPILSHPQFEWVCKKEAVPPQLLSGTRFVPPNHPNCRGTAMNRMEAITWVLSVCTDLRLSQAKTLAHLVAAALHVGRVSLANLGRRLLGEGTVKSRIQRTWRFTANERVSVSDGMHGVLRRLLGKKRKRPLLVALDWTEIRDLHTLMAAAVLKGRAVPLLWASYPEWVLHKSQNNLEEGLLRLLKALLPEGLPLILLAGRGFGRTELARTCQRLGFAYVIRIRPDVWVECPAYRGQLLDLPVQRGVCRLLADVAFRKQHPVRQHVVVRWKRGLPTRRDEPWFLMSNLRRPALALSQVYSQRMTIEGLFRDDKNRRNAWAFRDPHPC